MTVSYENSKTIFEGIKAAGIRSVSALPETWLGLLLGRIEEDPDMTLVQVARLSSTLAFLNDRRGLRAGSLSGPRLARAASGAIRSKKKAADKHRRT